jgi:hypothetical protein
VAKLVFLDSEPLGLASKPAGKADADACRTWLGMLESTGALVLIPEIVDYEVRRELVRVGATAGLRRLDALLPLGRPALLQAADLWAHVRKSGAPTAHPHSLDADAILAGQVLTATGPGDVAVVATSMFAILAASLESMLVPGQRLREDWSDCPHSPSSYTGARGLITDHVGQMWTVNVGFRRCAIATLT